MTENQANNSNLTMSNGIEVQCWKKINQLLILTSDFFLFLITISQKSPQNINSACHSSSTQSTQAQEKQVTPEISLWGARRSLKLNKSIFNGKWVSVLWKENGKNTTCCWNIKLEWQTHVQRDQLVREQMRKHDLHSEDSGKSASCGMQYVASSVFKPS